MPTVKRLSGSSIASLLFRLINVPAANDGIPWIYNVPHWRVFAFRQRKRRKPCPVTLQHMTFQ